MLLFLSTVAIGLFYGAGLMWGRNTHLVHGRVLALVGGAPVGRGLLRGVRDRGHRLPLHPARPGAAEHRDRAVLFATIVFLAGGVLGTFHHLYFTGTPTAVLALGATFSRARSGAAGAGRLRGLRDLQAQPRDAVDGSVTAGRSCSSSPWRSGTWSGAGLFGFLINPPLALYYMQGLNTTPLHGHTALFGVYGMLGIGLMLFCLRGLSRTAYWDEKLLAKSFWAMNIGLALMALLSLLPMGLLQVAGRGRRTASGTRARPSSCSSRCCRPSSGCACRAT